MKKIFLTIFLCSISYSQSPISAVSVATDTLFSFLNTHIFVHDTVFLHVPLDTAYTNAKLSAVYMDTTQNTFAVRSGDTIQIPENRIFMLDRANHALNKQQFDSMSIGQSTIPVGYMVGLHGNLSDTQTVNNPSYPEVNLSQTGQIVLDGSGFTGTDYTMGTHYIGVKFTPNANYPGGDLIISVKRSGTITNTNDFLSFGIIDDLAGVPDDITGGFYVVGSGNIFYNQLTGTYQNFNIGMVTNSSPLSAGTAYWLLIYWSSAPSGANVVFNSNTNTNYGVTSPDGAAWTNTNAQLNYKFRAPTGSVINVYSSNVGLSAGLVTTGAIYSNVDDGWAVYGNSGNGGGVYGSGGGGSSYGVWGRSANGVGVQGESVSNIALYARAYATIANTSTGSYAGEFQNTYGTTANFEKLYTLGQADTTDMFQIYRHPLTNSVGSINLTGDVLVIRDTKSGSGTVSGSLFKGKLEDTVRFDFNPRVVDGANVYAYMFDTKVALANATARLMQWRNHGTPKISFYASGGASFAGNDSVGGTLNVTGATTLSNNLGINTPEVSTSNISVSNNNKSANILLATDTLGVTRWQVDSTWRWGFGGAATSNDEIVIRNTKNLATILDLRNSSNTTLDLFDSLGIAHIGGNTGTTTTDMEISNQQFRAYFVKMKSQSGNADKFDIDSSGGVTILHGFTMDGGNGVIGTPDTISWTAQTTSISSKNFSNTATGHFYRFTYYVSTTTTSTSGGTVSISTAWNDGVAQTFTSGTALLSATGVTGMIGGTEEMYVASGTPSWSTTISGVIVGSPQYQVRAALEMIW